MAKKRKAPKTKTRTITRYARRAGGAVRRGASRAGSAIAANKDLLVMAGAAVAFGYLKGKQEKAVDAAGGDKKKAAEIMIIPHVKTLGIPMTYGIGLLVASAFLKGKTGQICRSAGIGATAIGLADLGKNIARSKDGEVNLSFIAGDDNISGYMPAARAALPAGNSGTVSVPVDQFKQMMSAFQALEGDDELEGDELEGDELDGEDLEGDDELEGDDTISGEYEL